MMFTKRHLVLASSVIAVALLVVVALPSLAQTPTLSVSTSSLPNGEQTVAYSASLTASGGTTPYSWSIVGGSLPAGLSLNAMSGQISGTPTRSGTAGFTAKVTDSSHASATRQLSITIVSRVTITTSSAPNGEQNVAFSATLTASGGTTPYSWSITAGSLPAGLSLNATSGQITGTPTTVGIGSFTARVADAAGGWATRDLSITIAAPVTVSTSSLPGGVVGTAYSTRLAASGGVTPFTWTISAGSLPAGLTLNATSGQISGMPTTAGTAGITARVTDAAGGSSTRVLSITVTERPVLTVTTSSLPSGEQSVAYSATLSASGGTTPYSWSISAGSLPAGLSLNTTSGQITGTPTTVGSSTFTARVTDAANASATRDLSITIVSASVRAPTITSAASTTFVVGKASSFTVTTTGSPTPSITESGPLPSGVTFTDNGNGTGTLAGTPAAGTAGSYPITFAAANGVAPNASQSFTLVVSASAPAPAPAAAAELTTLAQAVQGVGPGRSLAAKIRVAQMDVAGGNTHGACGVLQGFVAEVGAQSGKKISASVASQLIAEAHQVETQLGC